MNKALAKWALKSESHRAIRAMIDLAKSEPGIAVRVADMDREPWLLNCRNGTIELRGEPRLREHRRSDLITKLCPVEYHPDAASALWEQFLEDVMPDERTRRFAQKVAGRTLSGATGEDIVAVIHGPTRSGKGTFQTALASALGDYATTAELELVQERSRHADASQARPELVRLRATRMVNIYESEPRRLNAALLKSISGSDPITARGLYQKPITFVPQFTLWIASNYRPRLPLDDDAVWERVRELPFPKTIPPEKRDPRYREELRDPTLHGAAILAWMVEGCRLWQAEGLGQLPPQVASATADYRKEMNPLAEFVAACCMLDPKLWTPATQLYGEHERWCDEHGGKPVYGERWSGALTALGCTPTRDSRNRGWQGIGLPTTGNP